MTRREYYPDNQPVPPLEVPEAGEHLWEWYGDLARRLYRVTDGVCRPIPPSEWIAWQQITGHIVYPWEYDILSAMDVAFCDETNKELEAKRAIDADEAERKSKSKGR